MPDKSSFTVTPYEVEGRVDYELLDKQFGIKPIDDELKKKLVKHTSTQHFMISRGIFYAQRQLDWLLDQYEKGNRFYIYTGIAPSGTMTIGHLIPFIFARWLQERFEADVYIQIPDEEKFLYGKNPNLTLEETHRLAYEDALDIISLGFKPNKTKIFLNTEYSGKLYKQAVRVAKHITFSMIKDAFGITTEDNIGRIFYTSMQAVPAFIKSVEQKRNVPCLIPMAVDQDVHFRIARDAIAKLGYDKPASIYAKFLPGLDGSAKMSTSKPNTAIYLSDSHETVKKKVSMALTGQQATAELQRKYGGNPDKCVVCQYYKYLFEPDDKKLAKIFDAERHGTLLAGEHKADLTKRINSYLDRLRNRRERAKLKLGKFIVKD